MVMVMVVVEENDDYDFFIECFGIEVGEQQRKGSDYYSQVVINAIALYYCNLIF